MLQRSPWPPNYQEIFEWRQQQLKMLWASAEFLQGAKDHYRENPIDFIQDWCNTFDPRNAGKDNKLTTMPFVMFKRQREGVQFVYELMKAEANGLEEKSRDVGVTWRCCCISVHLFLFVPGAAVGWGSRKADLVDKLGDMDSIFERIRWELRSIPKVFWPAGFTEDCMAYMKVWCQSTGSSITGESGDDIGRGGRKLIYFKDESAHYERPEAIEASLMDNTRIQVDISSVNGLNNVFHRKREAGVEWEPGEKIVKDKTNVFITDWRDHPEKDQEWYDARKAKSESEGLLHIFYQEIDRNYSASVEGIVIPAAWVLSAIDAHEKIDGMEFNYNGAALDVADGGGDTNALSRRRGVVLKHVQEWGERDVGVTTRRAIDAIKDIGKVELQYDAVGMGSSVKAEGNRLKDDNLIPRNVRLVSWNSGATPLNPDDHIIPGDKESELNKDFYMNLKAQGWWMLRRRFECTHQAITQKVKHDPADLISLDSKSIPAGALAKLRKELSQPLSKVSTKMKLLIDKNPKGTKSPNLADSVMMNYWPIVDSGAYRDLRDWVK